jgi:hypothetical protein
VDEDDHGSFVAKDEVKDGPFGLTSDESRAQLLDPLADGETHVHSLRLLSDPYELSRIVARAGT